MVRFYTSERARYCFLLLVPTRTALSLTGLSPADGMLNGALEWMVTDVGLHVIDG